MMFLYVSAVTSLELSVTLCRALIDGMYFMSAIFTEDRHDRSTNRQIAVTLRPSTGTIDM